VDNLLAVRFVQTCEKLASSIHGGTGRLAEEVVEADVPWRPPEEETITGDGHLGEAAETETVVEQVDAGLKARNCLL
jgi:hypothetical protein